MNEHELSFIYCYTDACFISAQPNLREYRTCKIRPEFLGRRAAGLHTHLISQILRPRDWPLPTLVHNRIKMLHVYWKVG